MTLDLVSVLGPTATGKTSIAALLAKDFKGEIISADSRQVYKGMDIGTGKDLIEFQKLGIKYHLIDIAEPTEEYNLFLFTKDFNSFYDEIKTRNKLPIMVGGTGLYLSAILQSYNLPEIPDREEFKLLNELTTEQLKQKLVELKPKLHNVTDFSNKERIIRAIVIERSRGEAITIPSKINSLNIGIKVAREENKKRITERLKKRLNSGMIEEVEELLRKGISKEKLEYFGLEYKFVSQYIEGKLNYNDMFQKLNSSIHSFAKRQMTWFRKMEREGVVINWFHPENYPEIRSYVASRFSDG